MIVQLRNKKVSNRGYIPITIDCNVVAFIVFEEYGPMIPPAHKAHQTEKLKLSLQEALDLLQKLPSESSDALTDDSADKEVPANYLLEFLLDS
ncbi:hypothetical protein TNCV_3557841 [Trichonephila clavipes]|uniref:Uncharacterized protein n=1 Tax=Trichonephila clavipes TaxID=2585209 RepID=A0A8X6WDW1_TRICX|nr:hypothetical protein TNCV_3557841 [Trichonephila clavipes]